MPTIATFFGIIIRMWHDDHPPIHTKAEYQGFEALVAVQTGEVLESKLPHGEVVIVKERGLTHQAELLNNWDMAQRFEPLSKIQRAVRD